MMGTKVRSFSPLPRDVSLEDLVPKDGFYRRLEGRLNLAFLRDLVRPLHAEGGRPSVDPMVFFKLQLVMFFGGLRSERELMREAADRLSVGWYLGYDLHEPLLDHSNLTRTRERFGLAVFRRFFEEVVGSCVEAGLVGGEEVFFDSTKVEANADLDSLASRRLVEDHLGGLFGEDPPRSVTAQPEVPLAVATLPTADATQGCSPGTPDAATGSRGRGARTAPSSRGPARGRPTSGAAGPTSTPPPCASGRRTPSSVTRPTTSWTAAGSASY